MVRPNSTICMPHDKANCDACTITEPAQFLYVQCYDLLGEFDVLTYFLDKLLCFIRLKGELYVEYSKDLRFSF